MEKISTENIDLKIKVLEDFRNMEAQVNGEAKSYFNRIRKDAIAYFEELGFPSRKSEEWKYTNISPILKHEFKSPSGRTEVLQSDIEPFLFDKNDVNLLVFVNGNFAESLSKVVSGDEKIYIGNLPDARVKHNEIIEQHFAKYADYKNDGLIALNTAIANDGAVVYVKKNTKLMQPVHIINIADARNENYMYQQRNLYVIEEGAEAVIAESYHTLGEKHSFGNIVAEVYCGMNSRTEHYKIQSEGDKAYQISTAQICQERDSYYSNTTISWGGSITRNNLNAVFAGGNTECHFYGLYLLNGKEHVDNHTLADHAVSDCFSNELYKGIIGDHATGVFNGKIMVRADAQKTNAYQSNANILLSDDATIYSKPQLEIFADDVKCSHGATSGQLSKEEMFYLRSRGISEADAKALLLNAFASDVIDSVKIDSLRENLLDTLQEKLRS